ncbi:hypothetical protein HF086_014668 [Spodoptera exigua]|uniref:Transmembrane protein 209 n=1 Tax=Spodoptera exigua TaxID=7107 RepID=A0A922MSM2_SPOEX|nr:hypothetical protein HF086_014668 [Spodoptera exigua]
MYIKEYDGADATSARATRRRCTTWSCAAPACWPPTPCSTACASPRARPAPPPPAAPPRAPPRPAPADTEPDADVSLSPRRVWRADASPPPSPPSPASPRADRTSPDQFIADSHSLAAYLRDYSERLRPEPAASSWATSAAGAGAAHYQLSAPAAAARAEHEPAAPAPHVWRRLHLEPRRLEQWNLNLRLWLHATILQRLVRELAAADDALAAAGLDARMGAASVERLRAAAAAAPHSLQTLPALLAYLEPFADQRYVVQRIKELARGGCLSAYRWNGGGSEWDDSKPTDAELVMHLLATYLDAALPAAGCARPFSSAHLSAAPEPPARGPGALAVHRVSLRPPQYALVLGGDTVEPARGRNNLLHTLLLFLAAAARADPPALRRLHLGRAGLNMLWIIGR